MCRDGQGVPQNLADAYSFFLSAAEKGDADSMVNLGLMFRDGQVSPMSAMSCLLLSPVMVS